MQDKLAQGPWVQPSSAIMELTLENVKTKDQGSHLEQIYLLSLYHGQILQSNYYFLPYGHWVQSSSAFMELTLENEKTKDQWSHLEQILHMKRLLSLYYGQILNFKLQLPSAWSSSSCLQIS
ncbi:uncharacterized protein [Asterias amurensis]|uniref:uncharacterized protein n=1 Tax=Asterias amurensis TaxID=7602 RepID=UPI003AB1B24B